MTDSDRKIAAESKKKQFLSQGEQYIQLVNPKFYMPFAGTYNLSGNLSKLNNNRGVPELEEAVSYFKNCSALLSL
jgi:UDP-MurNAc hydroxylase